MLIFGKSNEVNFGLNYGGQTGSKKFNQKLSTREENVFTIGN